MSESIQDNPIKLPVKASDQKHCFSCGKILHFSAQQCPDCGAQQPVLSVPQQIQNNPILVTPTQLGSHQVYCRGCGAVIHDSATMCPKCGALQRAASSVSSSGYSRTTAAILAFLLGGIGGHKFYLGKWVQGLLYLFFCWTFIPGIIGFIEGIIYLTMSDSDFSRNYV